MNQDFQEKILYDMHMSDIYYEKRPTELNYTLKCCEDGYIIFKPYHSYILPIWEYYEINIIEFKRRFELQKKLAKSGNFVHTYENGILRFFIEYINTEDIWSFKISDVMAKLYINKLVIEDEMVI